ncbi:MAG: DUF3781 domain-containing protein [Bacilli bacterium]|nr:DUF3781 domain-containing protein [Bacilli bacterium]
MIDKKETNVDSSILLSNLDKLHTTLMEFERIKRNLNLNTDDVVSWCQNKLKDLNSTIYRKGKNWYIIIDNYKITVNAYSYTIITAHLLKK